MCLHVRSLCEKTLTPSLQAERAFQVDRGAEVVVSASVPPTAAATAAAVLSQSAIDSSLSGSVSASRSVKTRPPPMPAPSVASSQLSGKPSPYFTSSPSSSHRLISRLSRRLGAGKSISHFLQAQQEVRQVLSAPAISSTGQGRGAGGEHHPRS